MARGSSSQPMMILLYMAIILIILKIVSKPSFKTTISNFMSSFNNLISQAFQPAQAQVPPTPPVTPTPTPPAPVTPTPPAPEPITPAAPKTAPTTTTPATMSTAPKSNCSCMPMDSDPNRQKIETPAGVDCYNHIYPNTVEECEAALATVANTPCCQGGGTTTPAAQNTSSGGDEETEDEEDEDEDENDSDARIVRVFNIGGFR